MLDSFKNAITTFCSSKHIHWYALLIAFVFALPTLFSGLLIDDYKQRTIMLTEQDANPFEFYRSGSADTENMKQQGIIPWWKHPEARLAFFRPVATQLMKLDYALWPDNIPMMHFHSVIWYVVLMLVAILVYRKIMPTALGFGLAILMFATDFGHGGAIAWLCNRNVIVAMILSLLAILCYSREQWRWHILGWACFGLSLACAEAAIAATGYFFAHEVFLSKQRWLKRIAFLVPYALITLAYLWFWKENGYGSAGPGFYIDPGTEPKRFLENLIFRLPLYLNGEFYSMAIEVTGKMWLTHMKWSAFIYVIFWFGIMVAILLPLLRTSALARFFFLGMVIAAVPISGSEPVSRSLWYVGIGAVGLLGLLFDRFLTAENKNDTIRNFAIIALMAMHFVFGPISFLMNTNISQMIDGYLDSSHINLPNDKDAPVNLLVIAVDQYEPYITFPLLKDQALSLGDPQYPAPSIAKVRGLTGGAKDFTITRPSQDTLIVSSDKGLIKQRAGVWGFNSGDSVQLDDVNVVVTAVTDDGKASTIEYRFKPGVLATYDVMDWQEDTFKPASLPAVGESQHYHYDSEF